MDQEDEVQEDPSKTTEENLLDFLKHLVTSSGVTKAKKLLYLNALVNVWEKRDMDKDDNDKIRLKEILLWFVHRMHACMQNLNGFRQRRPVVK